MVDLIKRQVVALHAAHDGTRITLFDDRTIVGYVSDADPNGFVLVDHKTGPAVYVRYSQVKKANQSNGRKVVKIIVAVAAVVIAFVVVTAISIPKS